MRFWLSAIFMFAAVLVPDFAASRAAGFAASSGAQQSMACHAMATAASEPVPPDKLPPPLPMAGIGNGRHAITTANPQAQVWFDQGLNLLNDFWDYEASRAFEQSIRLDPNCAMCYWGLYNAESFRDENHAWSVEALHKAEKLSKHATPAEKLYIRSAQQEEKARDQEESGHAKSSHAKHGHPKSGNANNPGSAPHIDSQATKTLRKLVALTPNDTEAQILLAESLMDGFDKNSAPRPGTEQGQAILRAALASHPDDSALNHYWIHAVEPSAHPEDALNSARKLGSLAPSSGHMVHMPGHIFYRLGDYEAARASFLQSMRVDEDYMQAQHVAVDNDWNYVHNLMYLIADLLEAGRIQEAITTSAKLNRARGEAGPTLYRQSTRDGIARLAPELPVALRSADWPRATELLLGSKPAPELQNLSELRTSLLDYTQGMQALQNGDASTAANRSEDLDKRMLVKDVTPSEKSAMPGMPSPKDALAAPLHSFLNVAALELRGSTLLAQGDADRADAAFSKAAEAEKELGYHEPPLYIRPVGEARGDALMRAHKYTEAKAAYQAALVERPNSGYPLFGIAQAEAALNNTSAADAAYAALLKAWARADTTLPQLAIARAWLAQHASASGNAPPSGNRSDAR